MKRSLLAAAVFAAFSPTIAAKTYTLQELDSYNSAKHSYATDINDAGEVIGVARTVYNLPIDLSVIDFEDATLTRGYDNYVRLAEEIEKEVTFTLADIEAGTINADAQQFLLDFFEAVRSDPRWQKVLEPIAIDFKNGTGEQVLFDVENDDYQGLTRSTYNQLNSVSEDGVKVGFGSAPYEKIAFTPDSENAEEETHHVRDFINRAVIVDKEGNVIELAPEFATYGGLSKASQIRKTDSGYIVVGNQSIGTSDTQQELVDDTCDGKNQALQNCYERFINNSLPLYHNRATMWVLDDNLNVTETINLGLGLTPTEDDDRALLSQAITVNSTGTAGGYSHVRWRDTDGVVINPVYFKNGEVFSFVDQQEYTAGGQVNAIATVNNGQIGNQEIITGYAVKTFSGINKTKFFYHNVDENKTYYPQDFFEASNSIARDINVNGIIVGDAQVKPTSSGNERYEGFIYDTNLIGQTDSSGNEVNPFVNVNDLLPCYDADGETAFPYTVAELTAINDKNEIVGIATKTVQKKDAFGELVVDKNGEPEFESIIVSVKLTENPNGEPESCKTPEQEKYERQGASLSWLGMLLLPLVSWRRRRNG